MCLFTCFHPVKFKVLYWRHVFGHDYAHNALNTFNARQWRCFIIYISAETLGLARTWMQCMCKREIFYLTLHDTNLYGDQRN